MLLKKVVKIIIAILVIAMIIKFVQIIYNTTKKVDFGFKSNIGMIKNNIIVSQCFEKDSIKNKSELKKILVAELAVFSGAEEEIMEKENQEEIVEFEEPPVDEFVEIANEQMQIQWPIPDMMQNTENTNELQSVQTTVLETNNKKDVYTDIYQSVQIKNESDYALTEAMVTPDVKYANTKDIIIYHTHTCESYTPTENTKYVSTGNYRTTDLNYSVARVGTELANHLAVKGYTAIHDKTYHDYPAYTGSYTRSLSTIKNLLGTYKNVDAVFDLHRDALRKQ